MPPLGRSRAVEVLPSIYAADFAALGEELGTLLDAGARAFHFDVGDGHVVEPVTIGPIVLASIAPLVRERGGALDCHLMVTEPERHFAQIAAAGGDSVTFHVEACRDVAAAVARARALGLGAGVALSPDTPVAAAIAAASAGIDLVLCMSIHPGRSGQAFMPEALPRIAELRRRLPDEVRIEVDGGVGPETIAAACAAGADLLVAGSSVFWQPDLAEAFRTLVELSSPVARSK